MAIAPTHYIWQRERSVYHSGAIRNYNKDEAQLPRGPNNSPIPCYLCGKKGRFVRLGLSSSSSSSTGSLEVTELCSSQDLKGTFAIEKMLVDSPASSAQGMVQYCKYFWITLGNWGCICPLSHRRDCFIFGVIRWSVSFKCSSIFSRIYARYSFKVEECMEKNLGVYCKNCFME